MLAGFFVLWPAFAALSDGGRARLLPDRGSPTCELSKRVR